MTDKLRFATLLKEDLQAITEKKDSSNSKHVESTKRRCIVQKIPRSAEDEISSKIKGEISEIFINFGEIW
jgi:hypothetical protein